MRRVPLLIVPLACLCALLVALALGLAPALPRSAQIAYVQAQTGHSHIFLLDLRSGAHHRLTSVEALHRAPVWTTDGTGLVYESNRGNNISLFMLDLHLPGSVERQLTFYSSDEVDALIAPGFDPAAPRLLYTSARTPNGDLYLLDVPPPGVNRWPERVTENESAEYAPTFSPDGTWVAYVATRQGNIDLFARDLLTGTEHRLTDHAAIDSSPAWSPDGRWLAFHSLRDDNYELYLLPMDSFETALPTAVRVTDHPGEDRDAVWSPDGERLAFLSNRDGNLNIYVVDMAQMQAEALPQIHPLTDHPALDREPAWSPDSRRIAFVSYRDGYAQVYSAPVPYSGKAPRPYRLTSAALDSYTPVWRP
jgi:TolB protein